MKKLILLLSILALTLGLFATVSVTGAIVGSDNPTAGLSGGTINLYGELDYIANTNDSGQFVVEDVLSGNSYDYTISRAGYQSATGTIIVGSTSYDMDTITLNEITMAPSAVVAIVNDTDTAVNLTWEAPPIPGNYYLFDFENDNGDWVPSSNWTDPLGDWEYAANYDVANWNPSPPGNNITPPLAAYSGTGMWGTVINSNHHNSGGFSYLSQTLDFSAFDNTQLKFWSWENVLGSFDYCQVSINGTVVWGPSWDHRNTIWRERVIDLSAYDGLSDVVVRFEMFATISINYAGWYIDDVFIGPAADVVSTSPPSIIPAEFRGFTEPEATQLAEERAGQNPARELADGSREPSHNSSRVPVGYKVWRLAPGQENAPDLWTSLTPAMITDTTFTDSAWESFPNGFYKWAVRTIYTNDVVSGPGFSNTVRKESNDMSALSIIGNTVPTVGAPSVYTVTVRNVGTSPQAAGAYTVKIMSGTTELTSIAGPAIAVDQTLDVAMNWNPTEQGSIQIYGKVMLPDDSDPTNDTTPPLSVAVMEEGLLVIGIGTGTDTNAPDDAPSPYGTKYRAFRQQLLYRADEFYAAGGTSGMITALAFNVQSTSACLLMSNYRIRLKLTDNEDLSTTFETGEYTTVWQRTLFMPSLDWNVHTFDEPFYWDGSSNVIVEIVTDMIIANITNNALTYYSTTDYLSSLRFESNTVNGIAGTTGSTSNNRSNIRFFLVNKGDITGTVLADSGSPLADVQVHVGVRDYTTMTDAEGEFIIPNVLVNDYAVTFSRHGYVTQTIDIVLEEDETEVMNVTMNLMAQVDITGTILANDTGSGIAGANINLVGYENYSGSSTDNGSFTIPAVFANHSYAYSISAVGYASTGGTIDVAAANYGMGDITLNEIAYAPNTVEAELNAAFNAANLSWSAPDLNAIEITEGFEAATFPPADWSQIITNTGAASSVGVLPTWCSIGVINIPANSNAVPTEGIKQAGLWWDYTHQNEWLLTPSFSCPPDAYLTFDTYTTMGSSNGDHYYVKVSSDGGNTWTVLWDASTQAEGGNFYAYPISVDLAAYVGLEVKLAFHAEDPPSNDGLWYEWFIDNVYIGNSAENICFSASEITSTRLISSSSNIGSGNTPDRLARVQDLQSCSHSRHNDPARSITRTLEGYKIWRLSAGQENNEAMWTSLTAEMVTALNYEDQGWATIPDGTYKWAIKALYSTDIVSVPAFSNSLVKEIVNGNIVGFVKKINGQGLVNATITAEGGYSTTSNNSGAYSLSVPTGIYSVTATAAGYDSLTQVDIAVSPNQYTTLNFTMIPVSNEDELLPINITALNGNYPNPFNPETIISYDLKEAGSVRLGVYNVKGQLVRSLVNQDQASGRYRVVFNARDDRGNPLSSGLYLYRFTTGSYSDTRKMMLME